MPVRAFTIIEVLIVLLLVALLATFAALSLRGKARVADMDEAVDRVSHLDRTARDRAVRAGEEHRLIVDLDQATIRLQIDAEQSSDIKIDFDNSIRLSALWLKDRPITSGMTSIPFQPNGASPSYTIVITDQTGISHRLLFAGATGQVTELEDDSSITAFFKMQKPPSRGVAD